ncbi:cysteine synthase family protein [Sphingobacterium sp. SGG-5]|uniref:PLP-dependent cysteine synthase family protein n=1 Tax=Sphingobacterium sp. SGG-5 TaxID=2710881 RepID=UPI0013EAAFE5|nr:cysteine synthase family protein [Sphingobacterium sp. SGG-5]NGM61418.1 cysteine synthase family protein [Sphingobacterium sp. SGG-5]
MKLSTIGNTPLRKNTYLSEKYQCTIYIKEEFCNLSKSSKDRPAWYMVKEAIAQKKIQPGGTFVEASSGNTGIGIARLAGELGYKAKVFVSKNCSREKLDMLKRYGACIEICENSHGMLDPQSTQYRAQEYAQKHTNAYYTNQYCNQANLQAHFETTGPEIWQQTAGKITHFFAGIGTGGTISGTGKFLKQQTPKIKICGIEPKGSVLSHYFKYGCLPVDDIPMERIEGIGRTFVPEVFDAAHVDMIYQVDLEESKHNALSYYKQQRELIGFSSAAVLAGLETHIQQHTFGKDAIVVLLFADHGERYKQVLYPDLPHTESSYGIV